MAVFAFCAALTVLTGVARGSELVPERYLRPRDFNHHPFTDVGESAAGKTPTELSDVHPYAILASKRPREGTQFPEQEHILYPNPPAAVLPRIKPALHIRIQPAHYDQDPYNTIPKNYAFSYTVKDKHSGDDFSHSQAHNGKATRGQYRVKLPDGRVQVVSYTADHKGYQADVQYEGVPAQHFPYQQATPIYEPSTPAPPAYAHQSPQYISHAPTPSTFVQYIQQPSHTATPAPYHQLQAYSPTPAPYHQEHGYSATPGAFQQEPGYSATPGAYQQEHSYSATPAPYHQQEQVYSATPSPYQQEHGYSPTPTTYSGYHQAAYSGPSPGYSQLSYDPQVPHSAPTPSAIPNNENYASPSPITFPTSAPEQPEQSSGLQVYGSPSPAPEHVFPSPSPTHSYHQSPGLQAYASPAPASDHLHHQSSGLQAYESPATTPSQSYRHPSGPQAYDSSSPGLESYDSPRSHYDTSEYEQRYASPSPSPFAIQSHQRSTPAPFGRHRFATSTAHPLLGGQILVTPRIQRNSKDNNSKDASRRVFGEREHVIYRYKSSS